MAHRKWKEIKQQPSLLPGPAVPGCSLVSLHFLWAILCPQAVQITVDESNRGMTLESLEIGGWLLLHSLLCATNGASQKMKHSSINRCDTNIKGHELVFYPEYFHISSVDEILPVTDALL